MKAIHAYEKPATASVKGWVNSTEPKTTICGMEYKQGMLVAPLRVWREPGGMQARITRNNATCKPCKKCLKLV